MTESRLNEIKNKLSTLDIHVIPYCHADYAWTHPRAWHINRYIQIIEEVLDILKRNPEYRWMADNILHIMEPYYSFLDNRKNELTHRINEGKIEITNCMMSLLRPTVAAGETFIRNIIYGRKWLIKHGINADSVVFHNVDVSMGHSQLPQLLKLSGYEYYRGWRPQGALDSKKIPREFIWKGLDGSEIICSRGTYAGLWKTDYLNKLNYNDEDGTLTGFYLNELDDILSHIGTGIVWLPFGMDDTRPLKDFNDTPVNMDEFMAYLRLSTGTSVKYSTAREYFKSLSQKPLQVHDGILDPCDVSYNIPTKGDKGLWYFRDLLDSLITRAEILWTMASDKISDYPSAAIDTAWENLLFISGHAMEFVFSEDYGSLYEVATSTVGNVHNLIDSALLMIAGEHSGGTHSNLLINTLEHDIRGIFPISLAESCSGRVLKLFDDMERPIDFQIAVDNELLVDISIPAFGTKSIFAETLGFPNDKTKPNDLPDDIITIDTGKIKVVFDRGRIIQINDLHLKASSLFGSLSFTEIEPTATDAWLNNYNHGKCHEMFPTEWKLKENGPLRWKYEVSGFSGPASFISEITLSRNSRNIGYDITLECKDKSNGFFATSFPAGSDPSIRAGIPFGTESRAVSTEPYGRQTEIDIDNLERLWPGLFYTNTWLSYKYKDLDFTILREKLPSYFSYDSETGNISALLTRTFNLDACSDWIANTHPFNECIGKSNFRFSLHVGNNPSDTNLFRLYRELRNPPEQISIPSGTADSRIYQTPFIIKSDSCILSALYKDNEVTFIRVFNTIGYLDELSIETRQKIKSCRAVDFKNNTITGKSNIKYSDYSITTEINKYEILTLAVEF